MIHPFNYNILCMITNETVGSRRQQRLVSKLAIAIELSNEQAIEQSWVLDKIGNSRGHHDNSAKADLPAPVTLKNSVE